MLPMLVELAFLVVTNNVPAPPPPRRKDPLGCTRTTRPIYANTNQICVYTDYTIALCRETLVEYVRICPGKPPESIGVDNPALRSRSAKSTADVIRDAQAYCAKDPKACR